MSASSFSPALVCLLKAAFPLIGDAAASGFPRFAKENNAHCIEINPEVNEMSSLYDEAIRDTAGKVMSELFG